MKPSRQFQQIGFKKKPRPQKQNISQSINRLISKQNVSTLQNTTQTDYLLSPTINLKTKKQKSIIKPSNLQKEQRRQNYRQKLPSKKRFQSFQDMSIRMNSKSFMNNISHRSRSKSKIDQKLDEMIMNQKVKEQLANKKNKNSSSNRFKELQTKNNLNISINLNESAKNATLNKYINELTQQSKEDEKQKPGDKKQEYIVNELNNIIGLIDGIFGISRSQKLVNSYRQQSCLSIHSLISTIKMKLQTAAKDSNIKKGLMKSN